MPTMRRRCEPVGAVGHGREAAHGVAREAGRDRRVRAVAQQAQRDVHADLRAAAGEQRALAGEVGARVALGVVQGRARRAELVVEGVDLRVAAACRCSRRAR